MRQPFVFEKKSRGALLWLMLLLLCQTTRAQAPDTILRPPAPLAWDSAVVEPPPIMEDETDEELYDDAPAISDEKEFEFDLYTPADQEKYRALHTPDSLVKNWKSRDEFWYADVASQKKQEKEEDGEKPSFWASEAFENILIILAIVVFAFLVMIFLSQNSLLLLRKNRQIIRDTESSDHLPEDIFSISYDQEIVRAEQQQNYRLATRLRFLRLLTQLSERNIIQYQEGRTNLDYLMQLHQSPWYDDFFRLTRHYEYTWYGLFDINGDQYQRIRADFEQVNRRIH